jgi:myo-inositol-1(or 4)-monophosphatase
LAAATLIVKEAGGEVVDPVGGDFNIMSRRVLGASTKGLALTVAEILKEGPWAPDEPPVVPLV